MKKYRQHHREQKSKQGKDKKVTKKAHGSVEYQLQLLTSKVRGGKVEDVKSVGELFAAWSEVTNIQSTIDSEASACRLDGVTNDL